MPLEGNIWWASYRSLCDRVSLWDSRNIPQRGSPIIFLILVFLHAGQWTANYWAHSESITTLEDVSRFYGPGLYCGWLLAMLSTAVRSNARHDKRDIKLLSADLILASAYIMVAVVDMARRVPLGGNKAYDFQAWAASHVVWATFLCSWTFVFFTESWIPVWVLFLYGTVVIRCNHWYIGFVNSESSTIEKCILLGVLYSAFTLALWRSDLSGPMMVGFVIGAVLGNFVLIVFFGQVLKGFWSLTAAKIWDLDQAISLAVIIIVLSCQWKIWDTFPFVHRCNRSNSTSVEDVDTGKGDASHSQV
ncbi:hypothetical protein CPB86DRAFT_827315 [Serendipita vermifera]|nr:hypothetical protein CPB86DRAFT_827315 [Serendipita vermifera]